MKTIQVSMDNAEAEFSEARRRAVSRAEEILSDPVIIAWKDENAGHSGPLIPGAAPDRWHDYGENNGGKLELEVGGNFRFIFGEAVDFFETDLNISSVEYDDGSRFLCLDGVCTEEDRQHRGYFSGGGVGG